MKGLVCKRCIISAIKPNKKVALCPEINPPEHWSAEAKLATVIETASVNEAELSEYCREKGLYVEQVKPCPVRKNAGWASG
ncbi:hypothetical protein EGD00_14410 [Pectobacterium carotovorum subsp. carotovorum]|nr:hypothetical protein EGD00_14410 [Pectobacterium carotovorum subsp. carotovorum]